LKNLEEPGKNISYFLSCSNEQTLLPTILSRCQINRLSRSSQNEKTEVASNFQKLSFGQKIRNLEKYKKKDEAIAYLESLILSAHKKLIKNGNSQNEVVLIKAAQKAIYNLKFNANVSLQMTNFAIQSAKKPFTVKV
jgi:DNA polymerase III delta prime subunit